VSVPAIWVRATWEQQVRRLRELGVVAAEIALPEGVRLRERFLAEFGDADRVASLLGREPGLAANLERAMRPEHTRGARVEGSVAWLSGGGRAARCHRFERWLGLPVLEIDLGTMEDGWATCWPGAFVSFDLARALVVSVDYEAFRCDLRAHGATPYR
jgi:hypothetical protein